jgi:hypothetical protein
METNNQNLPQIPMPDSPENNSQNQKVSNRTLFIIIGAVVFVFIAIVVAGIFFGLRSDRKKASDKILQEAANKAVMSEESLSSFSNAIRNNNEGIQQEQPQEEAANKQEAGNLQNSDVDFAVDYECSYIEAERELEKSGVVHTSENYTKQYSDMLYGKMKIIMEKYSINDMKELGDKASGIYELKKNKDFKKTVDSLETERGCVLNK